MDRRCPARLALGAGLVAVLAGILGSCGGTSGEERAGAPGAACGPMVSEPLDPSSSVHLLPGAAEPTYLSDPPTSGPHLSGQAPTGVLTTPIDRPTQVLALEQGFVLVQYRDLATDEEAALGSLAADGVVVAPNPELPAPVVATAWLTKRTCTRVDLASLRQFVDEHRGRGPAGETRPGL